MKKREQRRRLATDVELFVQQYASKSSDRSSNQHDPNDRKYNRRVEEFIKRIDPLELDYLLHSEAAVEESPPEEH